MRGDKIENIPNTFAPNVINKFFSLVSLFFLIRKSVIHYEQLPKEIQQLFDEYLKSAKAYSAETRDELK